MLTLWLYRKTQIDVAAMLDQRLISALKATQALLGQLDQEWSSASVSHPPEVDWPRVRSLEFQEAARTLEALLKKVDTFACVHDPEFDDKVRSCFPILNLA